MGFIKIKTDNNPLINMKWDFSDDSDKRQNVKTLVEEYNPEETKTQDLFSAFDEYDFKED
jgi:hypothetical protein